MSSNQVHAVLHVRLNSIRALVLHDKELLAARQQASYMFTAFPACTLHAATAFKSGLKQAVIFGDNYDKSCVKILLRKASGP